MTRERVQLGISGHSYQPELEPRSLTPFWPFTEQLPLRGRVRSWRMTHLDYRGEAGGGCWQSGDRPGGGSPSHQAFQRTRQGPGMGSEGRGATSPTFHAVPTPPLPPSSPFCQTRRFPAQPSCTAWPKPRNRSHLQPKSLSRPRAGRCSRSWEGSIAQKRPLAAGQVGALLWIRG